MSKKFWGIIIASDISKQSVKLIIWANDQPKGRGKRETFDDILPHCSNRRDCSRLFGTVYLSPIFVYFIIFYSAYHPNVTISMYGWRLSNSDSHTDAFPWRHALMCLPYVMCTDNWGRYLGLCQEWIKRVIGWFANRLFDEQSQVTLTSHKMFVHLTKKRRRSFQFITVADDFFF